MDSPIRTENEPEQEEPEPGHEHESPAAESSSEQVTATAKEGPNHGYRYPLAIRIQILTLLAENYRVKEIQRKLRVTRRTIYLIKRRAKERGFDPEKDPVIYDKYVTDGIKTGRPKRSSKLPATDPQEEPSEQIDHDMQHPEV